MAKGLPAVCTFRGGGKGGKNGGAISGGTIGGGTCCCAAGPPDPPAAAEFVPAAGGEITPAAANALRTPSAIRSIVDLDSVALISPSSCSMRVFCRQYASTAQVGLAGLQVSRLFASGLLSSRRSSSRLGSSRGCSSRLCSSRRGASRRWSSPRFLSRPLLLSLLRFLRGYLLGERPRPPGRPMSSPIVGDLPVRRQACPCQCDEGGG